MLLPVLNQPVTTYLRQIMTYTSLQTVLPAMTKEKLTKCYIIMKVKVVKLLIWKIWIFKFFKKMGFIHSLPTRSIHYLRPDRLSSLSLVLHLTKCRNQYFLYSSQDTTTRACRNRVPLRFAQVSSIVLSHSLCLDCLAWYINPLSIFRIVLKM